MFLVFRGYSSNEPPSKLVSNGEAKETGQDAVWSVSSFKHGFGVDMIKNNNESNYWQSDGQQPHLVNIQFYRKTTVKSIWIYLDYKSDESYTPNKLAVRVGNFFNDLREIAVVELHEPIGWFEIPLKKSNGDSIRTYMIQIGVTSNHQSGRDSHLRLIQIHSPPYNPSTTKCVLSSTQFVTKPYIEQKVLR